MRLRRITSLACICAIELAVAASSVLAQKAPAIRPIGPIVAQSTDSIGSIESIRIVSDGHVLLHDGSRRSVLLFDSSLSHARVVLTRAAAIDPRMPLRRALLLPMRHDSSAWVDLTASTMQMIGRDGSVSLKPVMLSRSSLGAEVGYDVARPMIDAAGRIIYRAPPPFYLDFVSPTFRGDTIVTGPESYPLLRFDPASRRLDTLVTVRAPIVHQAITKFERGGRGRPAFDAIPFGGDDWAMLDDGTIAIVRVGDYHVDWLRPDGTMTSSPAVPHDWTKVDPFTKRMVVATMRSAMEADKLDSLYPSDSARYDSLALVAAANPEALVGPDGKRMNLGPRPVRTLFVPPADLPDRFPPFFSGGTIADPDGRVWVRAFPAGLNATGPVYDVIDRSGRLVDRISLPAGAELLGLGRGYAILELRGKPTIVIGKARLR
jgi:hypothetical protein